MKGFLTLTTCLATVMDISDLTVTDIKAFQIRLNNAKAKGDPLDPIFHSLQMQQDKMREANKLVQEAQDLPQIPLATSLHDAVDNMYNPEWHLPDVLAIGVPFSKVSK